VKEMKRVFLKAMIWKQRFEFDGVLEIERPTEEKGSERLCWDVVEKKRKGKDWFCCWTSLAIDCLLKGKLDSVQWQFTHSYS